MSRSKPRVKVPKSVVAGETVTIKTLISHPMENGHRVSRQTGEPVERHIINRFEAVFNGEHVMAMDLHPSIAANPYIAFEMEVPESGLLGFAWYDDDGEVYRMEKPIKVG
ncbi:MAG: thiosulfate oxidation carrier complex protein SoxZ [Pseudomonadota bacterium]